VPVRLAADFAEIVRKVAADQDVTYLPLYEQMIAVLKQSSKRPGTTFRPGTWLASTTAMQHFLMKPQVCSDRAVAGPAGRGQHDPGSHHLPEGGGRPAGHRAQRGMLGIINDDRDSARGRHRYVLPDPIPASRQRHAEDVRHHGTRRRRPGR
jgi:hypothetical protein